MFLFEDCLRGEDAGRGEGETAEESLITVDAGAVRLVDKFVREAFLGGLFCSAASLTAGIFGTGGAEERSNVGAVVMIVGVLGGSGNGGTSSSF